MAGIGFTLRKLAQRGDLWGIVQGFAHSALTSTGPWLLTILSLGSVSMIGARMGSPEELVAFRLIIIYNFGFSLVFCGPVTMILTRYLSDRFFERDVRQGPGILLGGMALIFGYQLLFVPFFYLLYAKMPLGVALAAIANYFLICGIWLVAVFLSALRDHNSISAAFAVGMASGCGAALWLMNPYGVAGMLIGFSFGLAVIFFALVAKIFAEYRFGITQPFAFMAYFKKYWELALSGLIYNMAIWVDKWIMWGSPKAEMNSNGLVSYPDYDSAMFLAYLSIIPAMSLFVFSVETDFFENYTRFYRDLHAHVNFDRIRLNHRAIVKCVFYNARNFLVLQTIVSMTMMLLSPTLFEWLKLNFLQLGIFRFGVLGAFFQMMFLFLSILLSYFDLRMAALRLQIVFLIANAALTYLTMTMGFAFYGYGYFLASLIAFLYAFFVALRYLGELPYQTFLASNPSIKRA